MRRRRSATLACLLTGLAVLHGTPTKADPPGSPSGQAAVSSATAGAPGRRTREAVQKLVADVQGWGGTVGVMVVEVGSGEALAGANETAPLNPASNAKLVTAAAALRRLGGSYRFLTGLYGKVSADGTVEELVLRGEGDPSVTTRDLWAMAHELEGSGVKRVHAIAVDQSYFDDRYVPPAFEAQPNEWAPFRAPVAPVSINENTVLFTIVPASAPKRDASVRVDPPGFVDVAGAVRTTGREDPEGVTLALEPKGQRLAAQFGGHVPEGSRAVRVARRVDDPRLLAGFALRAALDELGLAGKGGKTGGAGAAVAIRIGGEREKGLLVAHRSAPLGELLSALGKESDNFYAEMVFKTIGAEKKARPGTHDGAAEIVTAYLREIGALDEGVKVANGSGLFDANRTTARSLTALLRSAYRDAAIMPEFVAQLSVGGVDGTLKGRFATWRSARVVRAKTGTLAATNALSGYVLGPPGKAPVAFSILVNGVSGKANDVRTSMDRVVDAVARELYPGG